LTAKRPERTGLVLVPALVCLVVVGLIVGVLIRQGATQRKGVRREEVRAQADWLVESGLALAGRRLADDPAYQGETWNLELAGMAGGPAEVRIEVGPAENDPGVRRVRVTADTRDGPEGRVRMSGTVELNVASETPKGPS